MGEILLNFQIAIDGPAGSGKSSISKIIAQSLEFTHIDTGAMYRAVTLEAINRNIDISNELEFSFIKDIDVSYIGTKTYLNSVDVSSEIRSKKVNENVSKVSSYKVVRDMMLIYQRNSASKGNVILDGRDIGSVVLPNADVKIFLTASVEERTKRRLKESSENLSYEDVYNSIKQRDYADSTRAIAPLIKADDAILVDTTTNSIDEVVNHIKEIISNKLKEKIK